MSEDDEAWAFDWQKGSTPEGHPRPDTMNLSYQETGALGVSRVPAVLVQPSSACSPGSEDSTVDSSSPASSMSSCASPTGGGEGCCGSGSPASPSQTTYAESLSENQRGELLLTDVAHQITTGGGKPGQGYQAVLISSAADSPAKTSPPPDDAPDSTAHGPDCSSSSPASSTLFDPDGFSSRTYPDSSVRTAVGTSESLLERWPTSGMAWDGGFSTHVSSECRSAGGVCSSSEPALTEILEPPQSVPARYSLSGRAAGGILRRAEKRGRTLPKHLWDALLDVYVRGREPLSGPTEAWRALLAAEAASGAGRRTPSE